MVDQEGKIYTPTNLDGMFLFWMTQADFFVHTQKFSSLPEYVELVQIVFWEKNYSF